LLVSFRIIHVSLIGAFSGLSISYFSSHPSWCMTCLVYCFPCIDFLFIYFCLRHVSSQYLN
jgi:hypothetical protein